MPSTDPSGQHHWLRALGRQDWVQGIRKDGKENLLAAAWIVAAFADWDTLESRPTWEKLLERTGMAERTLARWLQELRIHGWLLLIEHGSTPATRPMPLSYVAGNRAAVYRLAIPLTPEEALHRAAERLIERLTEELDAPAEQPPSPVDNGLQAPIPPLSERGGSDSADTGPETACHQRESESTDSPPIRAVDTNGSPPTYVRKIFKQVDGSTRARQPVDNSTSNAADPCTRRTALSAGSEKRSGSILTESSVKTEATPWSVRVPVRRAEMLVAADWLRRERPVFAQVSRKMVRHLCRPYWRAGWCNRDILHAVDCRPGVFGQPNGLLVSPDRPVAPEAFLRSRLRAWVGPGGKILPGYWSSRRDDAAAVKAARTAVRERHGRAGLRLLRDADRGLTAERVAEHGRACRPPASRAVVEAAKAAAPQPRPGCDDRLRARLVAQARAELARLRPAEPVPPPAALPASAEGNTPRLRAHAEIDQARDGAVSNPAAAHTFTAASTTFTGCVDVPGHADDTAYQRALRRAHAERGTGPAPRRHRRGSR